jgi:hypothetical protein
VEREIKECPQDLDCYPVYANTPSSKIPSDIRYPIYLVFSHGLRLFFFVLGGVLIALSPLFHLNNTLS